MGQQIALVWAEKHSDQTQIGLGLAMIGTQVRFLHYDIYECLQLRHELDLRPWPCIYKVETFFG